MPGRLPASEFLRVAVVAPLLMCVLLGPTFLSVLVWISTVSIALVITAATMCWVQWHLPLNPASPADLSSGRLGNQMAGIALMLVVVAVWLS